MNNNIKLAIKMPNPKSKWMVMQKTRDNRKKMNPIKTERLIPTHPKGKY